MKLLIYVLTLFNLNLMASDCLRVGLNDWDSDAIISRVNIE
jgi:hypothetical protein